MPVPQDPETFRSLWDRNHGAVRSYLARRCSEPDDLLVEVFTVAYRRLADVPSSSPQDRWWLYATARRVLANHRRASRRRSALLERITRLDPPSHVIDTDPADPRAAAVAASLASLSPLDREIVLLNAWEGLSAPEAAVVLGVSTAAAMKRLQRAKQRFADAYRREVSSSGEVPDTDEVSGAPRAAVQLSADQEDPRDARR